MNRLRNDLEVIAAHVKPFSSVLDVGCGDGALIAVLRDKYGCDARGMEIAADNVAKCVARGLSVIQGDADSDLEFYPDNSFDYAILSQTLQTTKRPHIVLEELLRVGRRAFVSFPNFAYWKNRVALLCKGQMPVTRLLPLEWYDTPNIHHLTVKDFRKYVNSHGLHIEKAWFLNGKKQTSPMTANLHAEHAVFLLSR